MPLPESSTATSPSSPRGDPCLAGRCRIAGRRGSRRMRSRPSTCIAAVDADHRVTQGCEVLSVTARAARGVQRRRRAVGRRGSPEQWAVPGRPAGSRAGRRSLPSCWRGRVRRFPTLSSTAAICICCLSPTPTSMSWSVHWPSCRHCCIEPTRGAGTANLPAGCLATSLEGAIRPLKSIQGDALGEAQRRSAARFAARRSRDRSMQQCPTRCPGETRSIRGEGNSVAYRTERRPPSPMISQASS